MYYVINNVLLQPLRFYFWQEIPTFLPIMRGTLGLPGARDPEVLEGECKLYILLKYLLLLLQPCYFVITITTYFIQV